MAEGEEPALLPVFVKRRGSHGAYVFQVNVRLAGDVVDDVAYVLFPAAADEVFL